MIISSFDLLWLMFFWRLTLFSLSICCTRVIWFSSSFTESACSVSWFKDTFSGRVYVRMECITIYTFFKQLWRYFCFLGLMTPFKGWHLKHRKEGTQKGFTVSRGPFELPFSFLNQPEHPKLHTASVWLILHPEGFVL